MRIKIITLIVAFILIPTVLPNSTEAHFFKACQKNKCKRHVVKPHNTHLIRIARCESNLHWYVNGLFDGGLQFSPSTWNATGSKYSFAYLAPKLEQKYRAVIWAQQIGWAWHTTAGWPVCG